MRPFWLTLLSLWTLAREEPCRTSGASMIAGYIGTRDKVDRAMCRFARAYADQTERDYQTLVAAVARGVLPLPRPQAMSPNCRLS
jgi:hypothetical protein